MATTTQIQNDIIELQGIINLDGINTSTISFI